MFAIASKQKWLVTSSNPYRALKCLSCPISGARVPSKERPVIFLQDNNIKTLKSNFFYFVQQKLSNGNPEEMVTISLPENHFEINPN